MSKKAQNSLGIFDKLCLRYYAIIPIHFLAYFILQKTNSIAYASFIITFIIYGVGAFYKDNAPPLQNSQIQYYIKSKFPIICLFFHIASTSIFFIYFWKNYDTLVNNLSDAVAGYFLLLNVIGAQFNSIHQLMHQNSLFCQTIAFIALTKFQFTQYFIEHIYFHHKKVGSPQDIITCPKNKIVYKYFIDTIMYAYQTTFSFSKLIFSLSIFANLCYLFMLSYLTFLEQKSFIQGFQKVGYFIGFGYFGVFSLQLVEYLQHYGLVYRKSVQKNPKVALQCAWNTQQNIIMNSIILRFERHGDHHLNSHKCFPALDIKEGMPLLPFDYGIGIHLSLIPFLWFKVMNPFVDQIIQQKKVTIEHIQYVKRVVQLTRLIIIGISFAGLFN